MGVHVHQPVSGAGLVGHARESRGPLPILGDA
jgi:hypothetical protein